MPNEDKIVITFINTSTTKSMDINVYNNSGTLINSYSLTGVDLSGSTGSRTYSSILSDVDYSYSFSNIDSDMFAIDIDSSVTKPGYIYLHFPSSPTQSFNMEEDVPHYIYPRDAPFTLSYGTTSIGGPSVGYFAVTALCVPPFTKINGAVEIKDIKDRQLLETSRGPLEVAQVLKTSTIGNTKYVKFSKNCLGPNLPSDDLYITPDHPFNLGLFENTQENSLVYNPLDDDHVMLQIVAGEFVDELEDISVIEENFGHYYNLVFDIHTSLNMEGLDVCSHHPRTSPHILPEESYVKIKPTKKDIIKAPKLINYAQLLSYKPENMDEKTFIGKCLNGCKENKFQLRI